MLTDDNILDYEFAKVPLISQQNFQLVLVKPGKKYALYKTINTKFVKANYVSDGLTERGNNYDEYVDEEVYFVVRNDNTLRTVQLKKKIIKTIFFEEADAVNKFLQNIMMLL